jgi:hypothetical protein
VSGTIVLAALKSVHSLPPAFRQATLRPEQFEGKYIGAGTNGSATTNVANTHMASRVTGIGE